MPLNPEGELMAIALIKSREGVKNTSEILKVPGLGGVLIGPGDLSFSFGVGSQGANAPEVEAAISSIAKTCRARQLVACGTFAGDTETQLAQGFTLITRSSTGSCSWCPR